MSPASMILLLIGTWLLVAAATLWGMLRIVRRHQRPAPRPRHAVSASLLANRARTVRQQAGS